TPFGDLRDRVPLEIVTVNVAAHHGLLASDLAKKASTIHGAIQIMERSRFTKNQTVGIPKEPTAGLPTAEVFRRDQFSKSACSNYTCGFSVDTVGR
ncbi:hypothetical protein, partial [Salipiger sp. IMCC34102]|uniref:hypothetical protein n=1 Tax=Salipiger sp. IMCC34102 TaxID=2510647 RepID=UPI001A90F677